MSKLTQIENALLGLDGAKFQQLCDAYLHRRGYEGINPLGRMIGKDKVSRGTPDTWVRQPGGKYLFAEYTTNGTESLLSKIREDLSKCTDEAKTGLPVGKIQEVIFCHTAVLSSRDDNAIISEAEAAGVLTTLIGIGPLAHDLYQKYPGLARDFLNVEVDTGQVLSHEEFVAAYGKHTLATPLDTVFHFRNDEVHQVLEALEAEDVILLVGRPGVGKSRLALHCATQYLKIHSEYQMRCLYNKGVDLFEDLQVHFAAPGHYLILVDDADRLLRGFDYVLQLLREQSDHRKFKLLVTVRDYALTKVRDAVRPYSRAPEVELQRLSDDHLKQLVEHAYGIRNHHFLSRIAEIAQGNPRLAVMAARVALKEQTLESIQDVTSLYDEYYQSIREYLDAFEDRHLLRVAGIVVFLRTVDRANAKQMERISSAFGVTPGMFWNSVEFLHKLELVDIYEDEIVKTSDQVLATYLFYLAFFRERGVVDVRVLLESYFPELRHRLLDALHPIYTVFGYGVALERLRPAVEHAWILAKEAEDENKILHLMDCFGFLRPSETLRYVHERITSMVPEGRIPPLNFNHQQYPFAPRPSILSVLESFRDAGDGTLRIAVELLLEYANRRPGELVEILRIFVQHYGFSHVSALNDYTVEQTVLDAVLERVDASNEPVDVEILLALASVFLQTKHDTSESDGRTSTIYRFSLHPTPNLFNLRRKIWQKILGADFSIHRPRVLLLLDRYVNDRHYDTVSAIIAEDARELLPFIEKEMVPGNYSHCELVQNFLNRLERHGIQYPVEYRNQFDSELYTVSKLLTRDWTQSRDEYEAPESAQLREYTRGFGPAEYGQFLQHAEIIVREAPNEGTAYELQARVQASLLLLAEEDSDIYCQVLKDALDRADSLSFLDIRLVERLVHTYGIDATESILTDSQHPDRMRSLIDLYRVIPPTAITRTRLEHLLSLFRVAEGSSLPYDLGFLKNYSHLDPSVLLEVVEILLSRAEQGHNTSSGLKWLLNSHNPLSDQFPVLFADSADLLKRGFLYLNRIRDNVDYNGKVLAIIMDLDRRFMREYLEFVFSSHQPSFPTEGPDPDRDHRRYEFIWGRQDYVAVMEDAADCLYALERGLVMYRSYLQLFFAVSPEDSGRSSNEATEHRQDVFLQQLIRTRSLDADFMIWLFDTIGLLSFERQRKFVAEFVGLNKDFDVFTNLQIAPLTSGFERSLIPVYQRRVEFFESLLPILNRVELLRHRHYVEQAIVDHRRLIEQEKRNEFLQG